jgi:carbamoyltransferase
MSLMGIHFSHDSTVAFSPDGKRFVSYELERLIKERYFPIDYKLMTHKPYLSEQSELIAKTVAEQVKKEFGEDCLTIDSLTVDQLYPVDSIAANRKDFLDKIKKYFDVKCEPRIIDHHRAHAFSAFYQSPFEEALVVTLDGGGYKKDNASTQYFTIHYINKNGVDRLIADNNIHICSLYNAFPYLTKDIKGNINSVPGKAMGMQSYGTVYDKLYRKLKPLFYGFDWYYTVTKPDGTAIIENDYIYNVVEELFGLKNIKENKLDFWQGADLLATVQQLFEEVVIENLKPYVYRYNLPIVMTGGAALNVLTNTRIKNEFKLPVFVPCNANDTGTAVGGIFDVVKPKEQVNLAFANFDLFDRDKLPNYIRDRNGRLTNNQELISHIRAGKIIGIVKGKSECGPRALGNRSIICDPSFKNMKDILNQKVKQREWYRPFAPMVLQHEASEYFVWDNSEAPFMSFSAHVRSKYQKFLASITHVDYSARIQTINEQDNPWYHSLLNDMKATGLPVLLNTSFNIRGNPILNTIEDAFFVLDNTELDLLYIEGYLFSK